MPHLKCPHNNNITLNPLGFSPSLLPFLVLLKSTRTISDVKRLDGNNGKLISICPLLCLPFPSRIHKKHSTCGTRTHKKKWEPFFVYNQQTHSHVFDIKINLVRLDVDCRMCFKHFSPFASSPRFFHRFRTSKQQQQKMKNYLLFD